VNRATGYGLSPPHSRSGNAAATARTSAAETCAGEILLDGRFVLPVHVEMRNCRLWRVRLGAIREVVGTPTASAAPLFGAERGETPADGYAVLVLLPRLLGVGTRLRADARYRLLEVLTEEGLPVAKIPLADVLTPFQKRVFRSVLTVPAGSTVTYGTLAALAGTSPRAVGAALRRNPWPLLVPCHRVLQADGGAGGFSAPDGVGLKRVLLAHERSAGGAVPVEKSG